MKKTIFFAVISMFMMASTHTDFSATTAGEDHWPQWRGPSFNGMARGSAPTEWSAGKNIRWKSAIPGRGFSTPVIWGDRIYLTTAVPTGKIGAVAAGGDELRNPAGGFAGGEEQKFMVICLNRKTGNVVWEQVAKVSIPHEGYHRVYGSFASNSPVTDGKYLYVTFGSRGFYCYDMNGKLIWQKDLGVQMRIRNQFGEGGAPAISGDRMFFTFDQERNSFIVALDKRSGKELWRMDRDEVSSWSTPLIVNYKGNDQVIVSGTNKVRSYDPASGRIIWETKGLGLNAIPAPVYQNDIVYVMTGFRDPKLMAIKLGGAGDLTGSDAILWSQTRGTSYTPSPVIYDNKFYALTDNGMVSCFNATTGEPYYHQKRLPQPDNFKASPIGADGKLYLASESGVVTIIKMGEQFEIIGANPIEDEMFVASPVVAEGELFLRGKGHLYCVGDGKGK